MRVVSRDMHAELAELVAVSLKFATRKLREDRTVPLFAAVLDEHGGPVILNLVLDNEYEVPPSTPGKVELLRAAIRETKTSGGVFCAPFQIKMSDGATHEAMRLHADHVSDERACTITLPYRFSARGELQGAETIIEESDDLILPR